MRTETEKIANIEKRFSETCELMRKYMRHVRLQSFASLWQLYQVQQHTCQLYEINTQDTADIEEYAKKERIERFHFQ